MTAVKIGLMGFGRIGRSVFRLVRDNPALDIGAIADTAPIDSLAYLLKYDTIYGRYGESIETQDGAMFVDGDRIPFLDAREPGDAPWGDYGVDIVVQATGSYRSMEMCQKHLEAGAKKVILASTPDVLGDVPLLLVGTNDDILTADTDVIALGSNTSNAIAPILEILDGAFGVKRAFMTTVHAMTNSQRLADVPSAGFRQSRAAGENIIPAETNSAEIIETVLPSFTGKITSSALNVPVADGSTVDLVVETDQSTSIEAVNAAVRSASEGSLSRIVEYVDDPIVSSDVRDATHSAVFDSLATMVLDGTMVKTITWFNNGWGYSSRITEVAERLASQGASS